MHSSKPRSSSSWWLTAVHATRARRRAVPRANTSSGLIGLARYGRMTQKNAAGFAALDVVVKAEVPV